MSASVRSLVSSFHQNCRQIVRFVWVDLDTLTPFYTRDRISVGWHRTAWNYTRDVSRTKCEANCFWSRSGSWSLRKRRRVSKPQTATTRAERAGCKEADNNISSQRTAAWMIAEHTTKTCLVCFRRYSTCWRRLLPLLHIAVKERAAG